jgi:hypothetical protein
MNQDKELCCKRLGSWTHGPAAENKPLHSAKENQGMRHHENHRELLNRSMELPARGGWF